MFISYLIHAKIAYLYEVDLLRLVEHMYFFFMTPSNFSIFNRVAKGLLNFFSKF